jgi:hypothetical protein
MPLAPSVTFATPDGARTTVHPGGIIGRLASAALRLDDPRVSEAHALVSLRGQTLVLLALRGALGSRGRWLGECVLRPGQQLLLADGLALEVVDLVLPDTVMVIESDDGRVELGHPEMSLSTAPLRAEPGSRPDAAAWVWCSGEAWWLQPRGGRPRELCDGEPFTLDGAALLARRLTLAELAVPHTVGAGKLWPPLRIVCFPGHTEIHAEGRPTPVKLTRNSHGLIRETALLTTGRGSVHWLAVAERIWRFGIPEDNWYTNLARLRDRLREAGLPPDLLRCEDGQVRLALREGMDVVEVEEG